MDFIWISIVSYMLGSINGAQMLHHVFRVRYPKHITRIGTKNAGAQNVWMSLGRKTGLAVFLIDFAKGFIVILTGRFFGFDGALLSVLGAFAILGHNWPIFFHFRGGRGFAALIGIFYAFNPYVAIAASIVSIPFALFRFAGISPFIFLIVGGALLFVDFGLLIIGAYILTATILYAKRVYAEWDNFKKSRNKFAVLKNLLLYDRAAANPPSLNDLFS